MKRASCSNEGGENKLERKDQEKKRREHMKKLCNELSSLIPKGHASKFAKDVMTQQDNLDEATTYIINLKQMIEKLKENMNNSDLIFGENKNSNTRPIVEVRCEDSNLEVIIVTNPYNKCKFHKVINIVEEEGAEVVNASISTINDKIFYTIHSRAFSSRIGLEASTVLERLRELVS